jgi:hypothetical protein
MRRAGVRLIFEKKAQQNAKACILWRIKKMPCIKRLAMLAICFYVLGLASLAQAVTVIYRGVEAAIVTDWSGTWYDAQSDVTARLGPGWHLTSFNNGSSDQLGYYDYMQEIKLADALLWLGGVQSPADTPDAENNWAWVDGDPWINIIDPWGKIMYPVAWRNPDPSDRYAPGNIHFLMMDVFMGMCHEAGVGWIADGYLAEKDNYALVPEPATMLLLGLGLIGVAGVRRFS